MNTWSERAGWRRVARYLACPELDRRVRLRGGRPDIAQPERAVEPEARPERARRAA